MACRLHTEEGDACDTQVVLTMSEDEAWICQCSLGDLEPPPLFPLGGIQQLERTGYWVGPRVPP